MVDHNYLIPNEDRAILGTLRGKTLESIEGYRYDLALSPEKTTFYSVARLHMEDGSAYCKEAPAHLARRPVAAGFPLLMTPLGL
ncbi:hypothetical protein [Olsenella massiliensis]|uniref:hypothetical protein n=1 Tax=Olsenella massiliensis TaxID=1622075 RepID=UPI00071C7514|nr:hypothetical protein [Olsenella massiliensis]